MSRSSGFAFLWKSTSPLPIAKVLAMDLPPVLYTQIGVLVKLNTLNPILALIIYRIGLE